MFLTDASQTSFDTMLATVDGSAITETFVKVLAVTLPISIAVIALRKGASWLKGGIKRA